MERRASTVLYDFEGPEYVAPDVERRVISLSEPMLGTYLSHRSSLPTMAESGADSMGSVHGSSVSEMPDNDVIYNISNTSSHGSHGSATLIGLGIPPARSVGAFPAECQLFLYFSRGYGLGMGQFRSVSLSLEAGCDAVLNHLRENCSGPGDQLTLQGA